MDKLRPHSAFETLTLSWVLHKTSSSSVPVYITNKPEDLDQVRDIVRLPGLIGTRITPYQSDKLLKDVFPKVLTSNVLETIQECCSEVLFYCVIDSTYLIKSPTDLGGYFMAYDYVFYANIPVKDELVAYKLAQ